MIKFPTLLLVGGLLATAPLSAQQARQRVPPPAEPAGSGAPQQAVPRGEGQRTESAPPAAAAPARADDGQRSSGRQRDGNPAAGQAVPRQGPPPGRDGGRDGRYVGRVPYNYYYYPRQYYPYGYGAFGLGYFYYDPYSWGPYGPGYGYYPGRAYGYPAYDIGSVRIDVKAPKEAQVLVGGYYAGVVDDFDGIFQSLDLEAGNYHLEVVAPGFDTLAFDVRVLPGRKITLHGDMRRKP